MSASMRPKPAAKRTRYAFLGHVTASTHALTGMFEGIFNEGDALSFLTLGRNIERADMTSRIVDVRAAAMMTAAERGGTAARSRSVLWMSVLRSLSGYQMYRLKTRERVYGAGVVRFLLADEQFPRACVCCLRRAEEVLHRLPNSATAAATGGAHATRDTPHALRIAASRASCTSFIDRLQVSLARTNDELARIYFVGHSAPLAEIAPIVPFQNQSQNQNKQISA